MTPYERVKAWRAANPEKAKEQSRLQQKKKPRDQKHRRAYFAAWREAHPGYMTEYGRKWREEEKRQRR